MTANIFQFDDTFWLQLCGTAMGTSLACAYATLYYSYHEETCLLRQFAPHGDPDIDPLILYARLIDDAILIWDMSKLPAPFNIRNFSPTLEHTMSFGSLQWEATQPNKTVNFLDLTITANSGIISTKTFIKPMNLHLYIPPQSAHPKGVLKSLIFGTLQRYWQQNSASSVFMSTTRDFFNHLLHRGYHRNDLEPLFTAAAQTIDSKSYNSTPLSLRQEPTTGRRLFLHWEYHPRDISRRSIRTAFKATLEPAIIKPPLGITQFTLAYHNPRSLRNCLTKTQLQEPSDAKVSDHVEFLEQNHQPTSAHPSNRGP